MSTASCGHSFDCLKKRCKKCNFFAPKLRGKICGKCKEKETLEIMCSKCNEPPSKCSHQHYEWAKRCNECDDILPSLDCLCCTNCGKEANFDIFCSQCSSLPAVNVPSVNLVPEVKNSTETETTADFEAKPPQCDQPAKVLIKFSVLGSGNSLEMFDPKTDQIFIRLQIRGNTEYFPSMFTGVDSETDLFFMQSFIKIPESQLGTKKTDANREIEYSYEMKSPSGKSHLKTNKIIKPDDKLMCPAKNSLLSVHFDAVIDFFRRTSSVASLAILRQKKTFLKFALEELAEKRISVPDVLNATSRGLKKAIKKDSLEDVATEIIEMILLNPAKHGFSVAEDKTWSEWLNNLQLIRFAFEMEVIPTKTLLSVMSSLMQMFLPSVLTQQVPQFDESESEFQKVVVELMNSLLKTTKDTDHIATIVPAYNILALNSPLFNDSKLSQRSKWNSDKPVCWFVGDNSSETSNRISKFLQYFKKNDNHHNILEKIRAQRGFSRKAMTSFPIWKLTFCITAF